ncbi:unnamed protein product [Closterium sp. NIES-53]
MVNSGVTKKTNTHFRDAITLPVFAVVIPPLLSPTAAVTPPPLSPNVDPPLPSLDVVNETSHAATAAAAVAAATAPAAVETDVDLPELDLNVYAGPKNCWDIANMMVKEALASWKGNVVKVAMDEEIRSLIANGTSKLVERPCGVNIIKNRWVLMMKYHVNDTVSWEKARLVVKGFTKVYNIDYDETYVSAGNYITLRIFLSIVAANDLHLMLLDMKNAFL